MSTPSPVLASLLAAYREAIRRHRISRSPVTRGRLAEARAAYEAALAVSQKGKRP
jgi:hypothetical protein